MMVKWCSFIPLLLRRISILYSPNMISWDNYMYWLLYPYSSARFSTPIKAIYFFTFPQDMPPFIFLNYPLNSQCALCPINMRPQNEIDAFDLILIFISWIVKSASNTFLAVFFTVQQINSTGLELRIVDFSYNYEAIIFHSHILLDGSFFFVHLTWIFMHIRPVQMFSAAVTWV